MRRAYLILLTMFSVLFLYGCAEDEEAPVITVDNQSITLNLGDMFTLPDCTVEDNENDDLTCVIGGDSVDVDSVGTYTVTFDAEDDAGNSADQIALEVTVIDEEVPVINVDNTDIVLSIGDTFTMPSCIVLDNLDTNLTCSINGDTVNTSLIGTYVITFDAIDNNGNDALQITLEVFVVDDEDPVISVDDSTQTLVVGAIFITPDCTVGDNYDTNLTCIIGGDTVDTALIGTYVITFDVTDSNGNDALQVTLEVFVIDDEDPMISVNDETQILEVGTAFVLPDCIVVDNYDTDLTCTISGDTVDVNTVGTYVITFDAIDAQLNNSPQVLLEVNVVDQTAPVMTVDSSTIALMIDQPFTIPVCIVNDNYDTDLSCVVGGDTVDITNQGIYVITFNISDTNGNTAEEIILEVIVGHSGTVTVGGFIFNIDTQTITGYSGPMFADLIIPDKIYGVTVIAIGESVFDDQYITSLTIPASVVEIGEYSFYSRILKYEDITILGDSSRFDDVWDDIGLPYLEFDGWHYHPGNGTIYRYDGFSSGTLVIPSEINGTQITRIGRYVFDEMDEFYASTIIVSEGIEEIGESAFSYIYLSELQLPASLTTIQSSAFSSSDIENIILNGDSTRFDAIWYDVGLPWAVGNQTLYARENNYIIEIATGRLVVYDGYLPYDSSVTIPETVDGISVMIIGRNVFRHTSISSVSIPSSVVEIHAEAFQHHNLDSVTIPATVLTIGENAFSTYNSGYSLLILGDETRFDTLWSEIGFPNSLNPTFITFEGFLFDPVNGRIISYNNQSTTAVVIPEQIDGHDVLIIGEGAFESSNNNMTSVILPNTLVTIEYGAFAQNNLTEIIIPESVIDINSWAFDRNPFDVSGVTILGDATRFDTNWRYIGFPLEQFGAYTFDKRTGTILGYDVSFGYDVVIPSTIDGVTVTSIGSDSFSDLGITSVVLPNTINRIEYYAFAYNYLTELVIPEGVKVINDDAFYDNDLASVTLPSTLMVIGGYSFNGNELESITLPENLQIIEYRAFSNNYLTSITIPSSVVSIEHMAFGYNDIDTVIIEGDSERFNDLWDYIGLPMDLSPNIVLSSGFYFNTLSGTIVSTTLVEVTALVIPSTIDGYPVVAIWHEVFGDTEIAELTIPASVTYIGYDAFDRYSLESITILGIENRFNRDWDEIGFPIELNPAVITVDGFLFNTLTGEIVDYELTSIETLVIPTQLNGIDVNTIGYFVFQNVAITNLTIPANITYIEYGAFSNNNIVSLTILGDEFRFSSRWDEIGLPVEFNPALVLYENLYFNLLTGEIVECSALSYETYLIPSEINGVAVTSIARYAFNHTEIAHLTIPVSIIDISYSAFDRYGFESITVLGDELRFSSNWTGLGFPIEMNPSVIEFEGILFDTFSGTIVGSALESIVTLTIPSEINGITVVEIEYSSFRNVDITNVIIPATITEIGDYAFDDYNLESVTILGVEHRFNSDWDYIGFPIELYPNVTYFSNYYFDESSGTIVGYDGSSIEDLIILDEINGITVTSINNHAFTNINITNLTIPASITFIENSSFYSWDVYTVTILGDATRFDEDWNNIGFP